MTDGRSVKNVFRFALLSCTIHEESDNKKGRQPTHEQKSPQAFLPCLLDDSVGDVVFVEFDQRVHEALCVRQELLLRRLPEIIHLRQQRLKEKIIIEIGNRFENNKSFVVAEINRRLVHIVGLKR